LGGGGDFSLSGSVVPNFVFTGFSFGADDLKTLLQRAFPFETEEFVGRQASAIVKRETELDTEFNFLYSRT
jgi:hypothetical protein